jgi:hypothetical protein
LQHEKSISLCLDLLSWSVSIEINTCGNRKLMVHYSHIGIQTLEQTKKVVLVADLIKAAQNDFRDETSNNFSRVLKQIEAAALASTSDSSDLGRKLDDLTAFNVTNCITTHQVLSSLNASVMVLESQLYETNAKLANIKKCMIGA